jgi:hypothetical protein
MQGRLPTGKQLWFVKAQKSEPPALHSKPVHCVPKGVREEVLELDSCCDIVVEADDPERMDEWETDEPERLEEVEEEAVH